jgi:hypothetical protein
MTVYVCVYCMYIMKGLHTLYKIAFLTDVIIYHCGFDLHFPSAVDYFFMYLLPICMSALEKKVSVQVYCSFLIMVVVFVFLVLLLCCRNYLFSEIISLQDI